MSSYRSVGDLYDVVYRRSSPAVKALLSMSDVPIKAREAIIFPNLNKALLLVRTLCDNECIAIFDKEKVHVIQNDHRIRD